MNKNARGMNGMIASKEYDKSEEYIDSVRGTGKRLQ